MEKERTPLLRKQGVQTLLASLVCILLGLLIGYIALLLINPAGAGQAITAIVQNFWTYSKQATQIKNLGMTLVKTAPLLMCSLSVLLRQWYLLKLPQVCPIQVSSVQPQPVRKQFPT